MYKGLGEALGWERVIGISVAKKKKGLSARSLRISCLGREEASKARVCWCYTRNGMELAGTKISNHLMKSWKGLFRYCPGVLSDGRKWDPPSLRGQRASPVYGTLLPHSKVRNKHRVSPELTLSQLS